MTPEPFKIQENVPLAPFTTLGVGGPARYFCHAKTADEVVQALAFGKERGFGIFILGGGSNLLVSDLGFDGLVIHVAIDGIEQENLDEGVRVRVGAGESWDGFVRYCVENELSGVECLSGIPGTVGGTPVQNVGAYGQEVSETIVSVSCIDRESNATVRLTNSECMFSYRKSIFNSTNANKYVVCEVSFELGRPRPPKLVYKDLIDHFQGREPSLLEVRNAVLAIRRSKSMVIDPADPNSRSAGSFFKNPIVTEDVLVKLKATIEGNVPSFPAPQKMYKIPAAWLIENAGFKKGYRLGNAGISTNHALALINAGGASSAEIVELVTVVQNTVADKFSIYLQPEPVFLGFLS